MYNISKKCFYIPILISFIFSFISCNDRKVKIKHIDKTNKNIIKKINLPFNDWETNSTISFDGDQNAKIGKNIIFSISSFPPTFRTVGKDTRLMILSLMDSLVYETLLSLDPKTLKYIPNLASHWKISKDKKTYWFKINSNAKWQNGESVTSDDVVESFKLFIDKGIKDPSVVGLYKETFDIPEALSDSIVKVKCKKTNWRSFMYFSGMTIFPAKHLKKIDGASFLKKYQFQMLPGTGPYFLNLQKTIKGKKLILSKRKNYWGKNVINNKGLNNFEEIIFKVITDDRLELEKFKKKEFDIYIPSRAAWWKEELHPDKFEAIKKKKVIKKKFFNKKPLGFSGIAFNSLKKPFDDYRVRKAISLLWNVDELIKKLFFDEYVRCFSFFQGTIYQNINNIKPYYDPKEALKLLAKAGYTKDDKRGYLCKDNKIFEINMMVSPSYSRIFTPFQYDLKNFGIKLNLIQMNSQAIFEKVMKKQYEITFIGWTGLLFPNPESSMHSKYAEKFETNNITGIKLKEVDEICDIYNQNYNISKRIALLKKLDKILTDKYYYALGWVAPYAARVAFWDKFEYPQTGLSYSGDWRTITALWWRK